MTKTIDYYLTVISPWAYLGSQRLAEIAQKHRAEVRVIPINLGAVFPRTGGLPLPKRAPERQAYRLVELKRWSGHLGIPLILEPSNARVPDLTAACMVIAAGEGGGRPLELAQAFGRAIWEQNRNIAEVGTCEAIATETGHHAFDLLAKALDPAVRQRYAEQTEATIARGVFGAPTYVYKDEMFWGQDRLEFLDRALAG